MNKVLIQVQKQLPVSIDTLVTIGDSKVIIDETVVCGGVTDIKGRIAASDKPEVVEWNGEGLPPVGVECEFEYPSGRWNKGYYHGETASGVIKMHILEYEGGDIETLGGLTKFRKPETPEAKKERERLEAAYDLYDAAILEVEGESYTFDYFRGGIEIDKESMVEFMKFIVDKTNYRKGE